MLIEGATDEALARSLDTTLLARELAAELPPARAARILARVGGMDRREAFALVESFRDA